MQEVITERRTSRFGPFELSSSPTRLLRSGEPVTARPQTLQLLELLVGRAGEVVTREEIRDRLWGDGRTVEFERSINTTMRDLRRALGDAYGEPSYIETVPRRGYRFIAPVRIVESPLVLRARDRRPRLRRLAAVLALGLAGSLGFWLAASEPRRSDAPAGSLEPATAAPRPVIDRELVEELTHVLSMHYPEELRRVEVAGLDRPPGEGERRSLWLDVSLAEVAGEEVEIETLLLDTERGEVIWRETYRTPRAALSRWPDVAGRDVARAVVARSPSVPDGA